MVSMTVPLCLCARGMSAERNVARREGLQQLGHVSATMRQAADLRLVFVASGAAVVTVVLLLVACHMRPPGVSVKRNMHEVP